MKSAGFLRRIDTLGRIVLPIKVRRSLGIEQDTSLEIFVDLDRIILRKHEESCVFCGSVSDLTEIRGKKICRKCIEKLEKV